MVEYRKLISFGKNSFVVSLPKPWVIQNKLIKGDLIHVEDSGNSLVLSKKVEESELSEKQNVISIDGKSIQLIERELNSAYISNCRTIILQGKEVKSRIKEFQSLVQNLIALEIMEQTSESIVAKDFLNMDKVSIMELIKKMDVIARTMLKETCNIFEEDNYEHINIRDRDMNRLYFLLYRSILYNLDNPTKAMKSFQFNTIDLFKLNRAGYYLEGIADEARRIARFARTIKVSKEDKKVIESMLEESYEYYLHTIKAFYNKDMSSAYALSEKKKWFSNNITELECDKNSVENYCMMTSRIRRLISHIHNFGRLVYTIVDY